MTLGKYVICSLALATGLVTLVPVNAVARPRTHQVCHTVHHHGHASRECHSVR